MTADLSAVLQFRESTAELLDLYLQSLDRGGDQAQLLDGDRSVRALTARGIRCLLEAIDDHLEDRSALQGAGVDDRRVVGLKPDERLKVGQRSDYHFVDRPLSAVEARGSGGAA